MKKQIIEILENRLFHYNLTEQVKEIVADDIIKSLSVRAEETCDVCKNHPSVIIKTPYGRFCQQHVRYA